MGLDVGIYIEGEDEALLDFGGHWALFDLLGSDDAQPVREGYSDFWVDDDVLDRLERGIAELWSDKGVSSRSITEEEARGLPNGTRRICRRRH